MTDTAAEAAVGVTVLEDFDDPAVDPDGWDRLLAPSAETIFLTHAWQRAWWRAFGGDRLLLVLAERDGAPSAIAPLFAADEMLFPVGSGGSDYLDFIGRIDQQTLTSMLDAARRRLPDFVGFGFYHLPIQSPTTALLPAVAASLGLELYREEGSVAPYADLTDAALAARLTTRRSVRKEQARMARAGKLCARIAQGEELDTWLELFFAQHSARWRSVGQESLEQDEARSFCREIVHAGHRAGWLRFTMLEWRCAPAAFDISVIRGGSQLSWLVSRDASIKEHSPGRVLRAHVVKGAIDAGARRFDFGLGDEDYKLLDATGSTEVANWSLYR
jgi:CelD/BcsL family acetyltransferase involved in cellulose biosynthesis